MTGFVLTVALLAPAPVPQDAKKSDQKFQQDVAKARTKAIDYLKKRQQENGSWENVFIDFAVEMKGGTTGLATLALLEAGVPANDPAVTKAVEYLVKIEPKKTYVVSLQTQVLARVDKQKHAKQIQKNVDWLLANATKNNGRIAGWSYPQNNVADGSNTHFAVMALHSAAQAGAKLDDKLWKEIHVMYEETQQDKGWSYYTGTKNATYNMTVCALLGLAIAAKHEPKAKGPGEGFNQGMESLLNLPARAQKSEGYRLFAIAELGRTLGLTEFKAGKKSRAWSREDGQGLLKKQNEDGSWKLGEKIDGDGVIATAFGLYFLGPPPKKYLILN